MADRPEPMDERTLLSILRGEEDDSVGYYSSEVVAAQEQALDYYNGAPFGDEVEGRSTVVSRDVAEVVDWLLPELMRIFVASRQVVVFEPARPEDEAAAAQATDYANHIFWNDNPGFQVMHDWFKDALLQKVGVVKVWWDDAREETRESFAGLSLAQVQALEADPELEIIEASDSEVAASEAFPDGAAYAVTAIRRRARGLVRIANVPPEEFLISRRSRSIAEARYVAHRARKTLSDLIEMGFDAALVMDLPTGGDVELDTRELTRFRDEDWDENRGYDSADPASREVVVMEEYLRVDYDGDGIAELRKITRVENTILDNSEVAHDPFAALCPVPMPHKFYGKSIAEQVMDLQRIKSVLWRQNLDALYLANNPRTLVNVAGPADDQTLDDLLMSRPGGLVRVRGEPGTAVMPMAQAGIPAEAFGMFEYVDRVRENRTGITRYNQGMDADTLNKTATGIQRIMEAAQGRKELIARVFAETGVKVLFAKILKLVTAYQDAPRTIRLRDAWVPMDPRHWNADMDLSVNVGIGTGNKDQMLMHLHAIAQKQEQILLAAGPGNALVSFKNYYNTLAKLVENAGLGGPETFFSDPERAQPAPQPPAPAGPDPSLLEAQSRIRIRQMEAEAEIARKERAAQEEVRRRWFEAEAEAEIERWRAEEAMRLQAVRARGGTRAPQGAAARQAKQDRKVNSRARR